MEENTDKITEKRLANLKEPWKKGDPSPNPEGRPLGQKNYATLYKEALIKLAKLNDKSPEDLEIEIISNGLLSAKKGDYRFYKDVLDRLLGTAIQNVKHDGEVNIVGAKDLAKKLDDTLNEDEDIQDITETKESNKGDSK